MTLTRDVPLLLVLLGVSSCRPRGSATQPLDTSPDGSPDAGRTASVRDSAVASSAPLDALGTVYPRNLPAHPLATRLCEALHTVPSQRRAECCGGEPSPFLGAECARILGATLHADTVQLDDAAVDRCAAAMREAVAGCGWVTPSSLPAPTACQGLLKGKLAVGSVCRSSLECTGDAHCEGVSPTKTGVCTAPGREGAGCGAHVDVLATYLSDRTLTTSHPFCAEFCSLAAHKCEPMPASGSACVANVNCAPSQSCVAGRCSAAALGRRGERCGAIPCAAELRCDKGVCAPLADTGDACSSDTDCAAGGCVRGEDGRGSCGVKCTASLDVLHRRDGGMTLRLPMPPRGDGKGR